MQSSTLLSVPTLESLVLSNSSFSSSSSSSLFSSGLQSSDSQTDASRPHSPLADDGKLSRSCDIVEQRTAAPRLTSLSDIEATPRLKQSPCKRRIASLDTNHDVGYDSEREGTTNSTQLTDRTRFPTRKRGTLFRFRGLGLLQPSLEILTPQLSFNRRFSYPISLKTSPVQRSAWLPSPPRLPLKSNIKPQLLSDGASPLVDVPWVPAQSARVPPSHETDRASCLKHKLVSLAAGNIVDLHCAGPGEISSCSAQPHQGLDVPRVPVSRTRKAPSGIGLGLPSVLGHTTHLERSGCLASSDNSQLFSGTADKTCVGVASSASGISSPLIPAPPNFRTAGGIVSGARRLFKTYHYPKRKLYDIPESISPMMTSFKARTFAGRRTSPTLASGSCYPVAVDVEPKKRVYPPLLDAYKNPLFWFSTRSPTGRRTSPVVIHPDVPQNLSLGPRSEAGNVLF
ncbi:hypothetical protein D9615_005716 [Tricholomella constricta]|uniref:Uncharacterized protein n=1 Tax=Tricholomella constricta TaxID=117010 RepID=A0A8H5M3S6_9AGAR|nr:hypothetical protein D9615_005716 [Tricholomella constricta]